MNEEREANAQQGEGQTTWGEGMLVGTFVGSVDSPEAMGVVRTLLGCGVEQGLMEVDHMAWRWCCEAPRAECSSCQPLTPPYQERPREPHADKQRC